MGTLYIVPTPIGNLKDITLRAIQVLNETDVIACEDTRKTGLLLQQVRPAIRSAIRSDLPSKRPRLLSYYEQNELQRIPQIIELLKEGKNVALVSNAGTPTISDPGFKLVREAIRGGIPVVSLPGPSAILTALTASGLPTDKFLFLGYLPKKEGHRKKLLRDLTLLQHRIKVTVIFFEAPHRLFKTLQELKEIFADIEIVICRELTKIHEEIRREKISKAIRYFEQVKPKGELTLLLNFT